MDRRAAQPVAFHHRARALSLKHTLDCHLPDRFRGLVAQRASVDLHCAPPIYESEHSTENTQCRVNYGLLSKLDAGIGCCKAPVSFDIVSVAVAEPSADLALEAAPVRDTPIETLIGQDSKLGLGHVEPAAVLGRVVPFEALDEAPCLQRRKCLVE